MPRRRRSRPFATLIAFVAFAVAAVAGVLALRSYLISDDGAILVVDDARGVTPDTIPFDARYVERESPLGIRIDRIDLDGTIRSVGIEESGEMEIPDFDEIGWYEHGSVPGLPGSTVLAAHVSWNGRLGPFHDLGEIDPGDTIDVVAADGTTRTYQAVERTMYLKDNLPSERIWNTTGEETLVLITCGGDFNPSIRRFEHNIVIYAVPVASDA